MHAGFWYQLLMASWSNISFEADGYAAAQLQRYASMSQHSRPLVVGALASSFAVPVLMALLMAFSSMSIMTPPILVFFVGVLITAPTTCLVAVPLALLFRRFGKLNAIYMCLLGTLLGALALGLYTLDSTYYPQMTDKALALWIARQAALKSLTPGAVYGFVSAAAFCVGAGITIRPSGRRTGAA